MADKQREHRWVGFDLGGTKMMATVFDEKFELLGRKRKRTKGEEGASFGVERIVQTIEQALAAAELTAKDISAIGIGCPSPVDLECGIVLDAVNLGWKNVDLKKQVEKALGCPTFVLNDVDAGTFGENRLGAAKKARTALGVFPGTGIGGGCVYDGQIVHGRRSSCMEIGHVEVVRNGDLCGCGRRGCLETEASRLAISAAVAKAAYRGEAPELRKLAGTDLSEIRSGVLARSIAAGDQVVERIILRAAGLIGIAVANAIQLICPDVVVLGGGLVEAMPELIVNEVEATARARVMPAYVDSFKVVPAELGDYATVMGAAAWAQQQVAPGDTD